MKKYLRVLPFNLALCFFTLPVQAQSFFSLEGALAWQSRNDQRVPGNSGTDFSFSDFKSGPFPTYRMYLGHIWEGRHELRALYAPLSLDLVGRFQRPARFVNSTFASDVDTSGTYKFNSYRLTYAYHFPKSGAWDLAFGFTAKVRDAEVSLRQGLISESKTNVGFVPLLNFQATRSLAETVLFRFDVDGLAAPQGRAFDLALFLEWDLRAHGLKTFAGYRMVEGGADNAEVFNFAWIHYGTVGLRGQF